jgi:hypothetical protein
MLVYSEELIVRIWHGDPGHASFTMRAVTPQNSVIQTNVSWFPGRDINNHNKTVDEDGIKDLFRNKTADPSKSYAADALWEAGGSEGSTQRRYDAHLNHLADRAMWNEAKKRVDDLDSALNKSFSTQIEKSLAVTKAIEDLDDAIAMADSSKAAFWAGVRTLLIHYFYMWEKKVNNSHPDYFPTPVFAPFVDKQAFVPRENQKIRNERVLVIANFKRSIPGMYSPLNVAHLSGDRFSTSKLVKQDTLDEIHQFIPENSRAYWGLNLSAIACAWQAFLLNPRNMYKYVSADQNCAGVVHKMLVAGGIDAYVKTKKARIYRTPNEIEVLCITLVDYLLELNKKTLAFKRAVTDSGLYDGVSLVNNEIWPVNTFTQNSNVGKIFAMRKEQVGKIDKALRLYHSLPWTPENFINKYTNLVEMFTNIIDHKENKPNSDRRLGVDSLGVQIVKLLETNLPLKTHPAYTTQLTNTNNALQSRVVIAHNFKK